MEFAEYHGQRTVPIWTQSRMCEPMLKDSFSPWLWRLRAWRKLLSVYGIIFPSLSCIICIIRCLQELNSASETRDTPQNISMSKIYSNCWILVDCYVREMCKFEWAFRLLSTYCMSIWAASLIELINDRHILKPRQTPVCGHLMEIMDFMKQNLRKLSGHWVWHEIIYAWFHAWNFL